MRAALLVFGAACVGYGGWLLVSTQRAEQVAAVIVWLVAGVVLHDVVIAPACVALGWAGRRLLPGRVAASAAVVLVLLGPLLLIAVPGAANGERSLVNPTLLGRDRTTGGLLLVLVVAALGAAVARLGSEAAERRSGGPDPRRR